MTESATGCPKNRKCNFVNDEPLYDTKEEALIVYDAKQKAEKENFVRDALASQLTEAPKEVIVKIGKLHAIFWLLIVLSGIVWSFLFGISIVTGFGSYQIFLLGVLGTLTLAATVFSLSKDNVVIHKVKENSEGAAL
jgi:hypothetical protein